MGNRIVTLVLVAVAVSCSYRKVPRDRPTGFPTQAVWAGGLDGGSFILCEADSSRDVDKCTVYNEDTGQVMDQGSFRFKAEDRAARPEELKYAWADWGGMIGLADGRTYSEFTRQRADTRSVCRPCGLVQAYLGLNRSRSRLKVRRIASAGLERSGR